VLEYTSGTVGSGPYKSKLVNSLLTAPQYERRYYGSNEHFQTENAIEVYDLKDTVKKLRN